MRKKNFSHEDFFITKIYKYYTMSNVNVLLLQGLHVYYNNVSCILYQLRNLLL